MTTTPGRAYVLVVGMHRSGTSAVAGALGALGCLLPGPDDRISGPGNPEHHESRALTLLDEDLLAALGGSWDGPPALRPHWTHSAAVLAGPQARAALRTAFPVEARLAWKDPRLCLLLPFWRRMLDGPVAAVFVWRPPLAVARSLARRDAMPLADGLALWERYNRAALRGLQGLPVAVVEYDAVVGDPTAFAEGTATWLAGLEGWAPSPLPADARTAAALVQDGLRHERSEPADDEVLSPEQRKLAELLRGLDGHHRSLAASSAGPETPWTDALLQHRRHEAVLRRRLAGVGRQRAAARVEYFEDRRRRAEAAEAVAQTLADREAELAVTRAHLATMRESVQAVHRSTSWRVTGPVRWSAARLASRSHRSPPGRGSGDRR